MWTVEVGLSETKGNAPVRPIDPRRRLTMVAVTLFLLTALLGGANMIRATTFSAFDESTHLDYAWRVMHGSVAYNGAVLERYTLDEWSCHRQANQPAKAIPPCGSNAPAADYPAEGLNYNGIHPPVYYAITGVGAEIVTALTSASFFTGARLMSILWVFLGLLAFYLTLRYWRVPWQYSVAGSILLLTIPAVLATTATVTNDAPAWLAGSAALYVLGRVMIYRRLGWAVPVLLGVAIASTKFISVLGLLGVAIALLAAGIVKWRSDGPRQARPLFVIAVAMGVGIGVVFEIWALIQRALAVPGYVNPVQNVNTTPFTASFPLDDWLPTLFGGFGLGKDYYLAPPIASPQITAWAALCTLALTIIGFLALVLFHRRTPQWWLGISLISGCLLYPLIAQVTAFTATSGHRFFPTPSTRYASTLIPIAIALATFIAARHRLRRITAAAVGVGLLVVFTASFGLW